MLSTYQGSGQHAGWTEKVVWSTLQLMQCTSILCVILSVIKLYNMFIVHNIL